MSLIFFNVLRKSNALCSNSLFVTLWKRSISSSSSLCFLHIHKNENVTHRFWASPYNAIHSSSYNSKIFESVNPIKAFETWYDLEKLRNTWDPDFSITHFKHGATKAFFTIVELIKKNHWVDLRGLISKPLIEKLQQDVVTLEKISQTNLEEELVTTEIMKVSLQSIVDRKYCDIEVRFSVKERNTEGSIENKISIRYMIKFHREYTRGKIPDWTITKINIVKVK